MKEIARLRFAHLPTPIEELKRLSAELGGLRIYVKRDDATGLALGGNKTRKLEFPRGRRPREGGENARDCGSGPIQFCRQTAAAAAKFGLGCVLVLNGTRPQGN